MTSTPPPERAAHIMHVMSGDLWAGAEAQLYFLTRALKDDQADVCVVVFNAGTLYQKLRQANIPTYLVDEAALAPLAMITAIRKRIRTEQPNILHSHGYKEQIVAGVASLGLAVKRVRTIHGAGEFRRRLWDIRGHLVALADAMVARFLEDRKIAVSVPLGEQLRAHYGDGAITTIENGVDTAYIQSLAESAPSTIELPANCFVIACIGRLVPLKRQQYAIDAMQYLKQHTDANIHLLLIGEGPLREVLQRQVEAAGLEDCVTLTGPIDPIYPVLANCDLLIMPSDHEGLPITLLEAMTLKVPVVAHAVGGIVTATDQGRYAQLVTTHTGCEYGRQIATLLQAPERRRSLAEAAYAYIVKTYEITCKRDEYQRVYNQLIG